MEVPDPSKIGFDCSMSQFLCCEISHKSAECLFGCWNWLLLPQTTEGYIPPSSTTVSFLCGVGQSFHKVHTSKSVQLTTVQCPVFAANIDAQAKDFLHSKALLRQSLVLFCHLLMRSIGTITVSLRYGIAGTYKHLWPRQPKCYN